MKHIRLTDMATGVTGTIAELPHGRGVRGRLHALGIRTGVTITKISGSLARGPVVIQAGSTQASLGFGIARRLLVEAEA